MLEEAENSREGRFKEMNDLKEFLKYCKDEEKKRIPNLKGKIIFFKQN